MPDARALAAAHGVRVEYADLGHWHDAQLVGEYDPQGPVIRVNVRAVARFRALHSAAEDAVARFVAAAVAHELYHHYERIGRVARRRTRAEREAAAGEFARALVRG